ncbi:Oligoribonuclease [Acorus calamus]|uniref:Oligoribonuclease n=1 Tax=Acorus calamus TaxID=4465 RepID=A0AAV9F477_ACOCL|nr:Oligoribonuclease [Acorus calamus]
MNYVILDYRLSDVVSQGEWNIPILQLIFPDYWVRVISESPVPRDDPIKPSCWCWEASDVDIPRTRDIFNAVYPFNGDTFDRGWRHLWRLPVLPKLKIFMWKVLWGRLPTRVYLDSIGMHMDNRCPMCEAVPETVFHLFAEYKDMIKVKESGKLPQLRNEKESGTSVATSSEEYRLPLVWIDLKMTGLDVEMDRILEIACVITDGKLTKMVEIMALNAVSADSTDNQNIKKDVSSEPVILSGLKGPDLVIRQPMGEWSCDHNAASERVLQSTISEQDAEKKIMEFVKQHVGAYSIHLAGNSVYVDFFLKRVRKFHQRNISTGQWMTSK